MFEFDEVVLVEVVVEVVVVVVEVVVITKLNRNSNLINF